MRRLILIVLVVGLAAGGLYVYRNFEIEVRRNSQGGIESVKFVPRTNLGTTAADDPSNLPPVPVRSAIRIATFNLDGLDEKKLANHAVLLDTLVRVLSHFDVIALQGIRAKSRGLLVRLVEQINA